MGCLQSLSGLAMSCENNLAGVKKAYIANFDDATVAVNTTTHTVSAITMSGTSKYYAYNFAKQTGSLTSTLTKDDTNGTRYYTNEIALQFTKMEAQKHLEIEALGAGQLSVIIEDNNGKLWLVGYDSYVSSVTSTATAGRSFDDLNGYNITLSAMSAYLPFEITDRSILDDIVAEPAL